MSMPCKTLIMFPIHTNYLIEHSVVHYIAIRPSHFCGEIADNTNISITTSILPAGGSVMGVAVTSHRKA